MTDSTSPSRLDRLEALAETILLAIQQQNTQIAHNSTRIDHLVEDTLSMITTLAEQMGEMQSEIRGLQTENRRILERLERRDG
jgi:radical SAM superfamily enzyme